MAFRIRFGDQSFFLPPGEALIGRDASCQIQLNHRSVSRRHARLLQIGSSLTIEDLASRNGTFVGDERVTGSRAVEDGAELRVGTQAFTVIDEDLHRLEEETDQVAAVVPAYKVPEMRTCLGCRHLISSREARCPLCGHDQRRATERALTLPAWTDPHGRRAARRVSVRLRGLYVSPSLTVECEIADLSLRGAFVKAELLDEPGTPCDLVVFVAKDDVVRMSGRVVRQAQLDKADGMGVQFGDLGPAANLWLSTVVAVVDAPGG